MAVSEILRDEEKRKRQVYNIHYVIGTQEALSNLYFDCYIKAAQSVLRTV